MRVIIKLYLNNEVNEASFSFESINRNFYTISILANPSHPFNELLNMKEKLNEAIERELYATKDMYEEDTENDESSDLILSRFNDIQLMQSHLDGKINLIDIADSLTINYTDYDDLDYVFFGDTPELSYGELIDYINRNNITKQNIIVEEICDISEESYNELCDKYSEIKDKVLVYFPGNQEPIPLNQCKMVIDKIKDIANHVKQYNLSPFEEMMYVYDYIRQKPYTSEDISTDIPDASRGLYNVLFGDKVVCVGYAELFYHILKELGHDKQAVYDLEGCDNSAGHARNIAYVEDPKYKIKGIYFFDITGDSKEIEDEDGAYLMNYNYFANTSFEILDKNIYFNVEDKTIYGVDHRDLGKFEDQLYDKDYDHLDYKCASALRYIGKLLHGNCDSVIDYFYTKPDSVKWAVLGDREPIDEDRLIERIDEYNALMDNPITTEQFLKCLHKINSIHYLEGTDRLFNEALLYIALLFSGRLQNDYSMRLLFKALNIQNDGEVFITEDEYHELIRKNNIDRNIAGIKLTKVLKEYQKKRN